MSVTVSVPIAYWSEVVVKGGRTVRRETFSEIVDVSIDVIPPEDAPVALVWEKTYHDRGLETSPAYAHELRWFDGRLWAKLEYQYSGRKPEHVSVERLTEMVSNGNSYGNPLLVGQDWQVKDTAKSGGRPLDPAAWRSVTLDGQTKALADIQRKAEEIIIIDGMIWEHTTEPCYTIRNSSGWNRGGDKYHYVFADVVDSIPERGNGVAYRADRYDDMVAYGMETWGVELSNERPVQIAVLIPEAVRWDDEWPPLYEAIERAVNYDKTSIADAPLETMIAWGKFRDALADCPFEEASLEGRERLVNAAQDYLAHHHENTSEKHSVSILKRAFKRWDRQQTDVIEIDVDAAFTR